MELNLKSIKNVLTALLLGAIGSGLWSIVGDPLIRWFVELFITVSQYINNGYYDLLHRDIGKGFHEESGLHFRDIYSIFMLFFLVALPIVSFVLKRKMERPDEETEESEKNHEDQARKEYRKSLSEVKKLLISTVILFIVGFPLYVSKIISINYNYSAIVFIERSIEIVSPHLNNENILILRADYRTIATSKEFYKLYDDLNDIALKNNIKLPEFDIAK